MSRYGLDVTTKNGVAAAYIPHGVDTGLFQPPADKSEAKAAFGYQDRFVSCQTRAITAQVAAADT